MKKHINLLEVRKYFYNEKQLKGPVKVITLINEKYPLGIVNFKIICETYKLDFEKTVSEIINMMKHQKGYYCNKEECFYFEDEDFAKTIIEKIIKDYENKPLTAKSIMGGYCTIFIK